VKAPRFVVQKRALAESGDSIERFFASGIAELREKLGPVLWQFAPTKTFDAGDFAAFLDLLPRDLDGRVLRHALEVRHESFCCAQFVDLARRHGAAIVTARDSKHPEIADSTADFAYLRIMGASEDHALGYPPKELDLWDKRLRKLARGEVVAGLKHLAAPPETSAPRDVCAFFISGFKERNPAAAMDLIARLR